MYLMKKYRENFISLTSFDFVNSFIVQNIFKIFHEAQLRAIKFNKFPEWKNSVANKTVEMTDVQIKQADESQFDDISEFICLHFNGHEPIQLFHCRPDWVMDPPPADLLRESIASQDLLLAYMGDKLVGVLIASEITSEVGEKDLEYAEAFGPKGTDVFQFLAYIGEKANVCGRLKVTRSLHIHIVSVHLDHHHQGIARKLFESCIETGRRKKFPAVSVDATNFYTSKIAEKFQMKCLSTVTYDEYNQHIGKKLFIPQQPHSEIKTFAKIYSAN